MIFLYTFLLYYTTSAEKATGPSTNPSIIAYNTIYIPPSPPTIYQTTEKRFVKKAAPHQRAGIIFYGLLPDSPPKLPRLPICKQAVL
jgi:hypothetical protein